MNTPILYILEKHGAEVLQAQRGVEVGSHKRSKHITFTFLEHTLAINQVRVSIDRACRETAGFGLVQWLGENDLKADYDRVNIRGNSGRSQNVSLIPDSYFALQTPKGGAHFFLELDRGTMTTERFKTKILAYQAYYGSGAYQRRYGTRSLRVLTVTTSAARTDHLRRLTERVGGKQRYWFTTLDQIAPRTVLNAPIWQVAINEILQPLVEPLD